MKNTIIIRVYMHVYMWSAIGLQKPERERKREREAESLCNDCHQEGVRIVGPSEKSGTIEGEVGVLNTSQSVDPEDRHMEVLYREGIYAVSFSFVQSIISSTC